jgi:hypothetical protein
MDDIRDTGKIVVFNGGATTIHPGIFMSTSPDFASDYGSLRAFELSLDGLFDSLDPEHVAGILPLFDPYDGVCIDTIEAYASRSSDTWEMIEDVVKGYPVVRISEGGTVNYLVNDPGLLREIDLQAALDHARNQTDDAPSISMTA